MQVHFDPVSEYVDNSPSSAFAKEARRLQPEPDRGDALGALDRVTVRAAVILYGVLCALAGGCLGVLVS